MAEVRRREQRFAKFIEQAGEISAGKIGLEFEWSFSKGLDLKEWLQKRLERTRRDSVPTLDRFAGIANQGGPMHSGTFYLPWPRMKEIQHCFKAIQEYINTCLYEDYMGGKTCLYVDYMGGRVRPVEPPRLEERSPSPGAPYPSKVQRRQRTETDGGKNCAKARSPDK